MRINESPIFEAYMNSLVAIEEAKKNKKFDFAKKDDKEDGKSDKSEKKGKGKGGKLPAGLAAYMAKKGKKGKKAVKESVDMDVETKRTTIAEMLEGLDADAVEQIYEMIMVPAEDSEVEG